MDVPFGGEPSGSVFGPANCGDQGQMTVSSYALLLLDAVVLYGLSVTSLWSAGIKVVAGLSVIELKWD